MTEHDTRTKLILPKIHYAGWNTDPASFAEECPLTDGRIVVTGRKARRDKPKKADYLLRYCRDFTIAVVEAKKQERTAAQGLQQAKQYAEMLGLKFAYRRDRS